MTTVVYAKPPIKTVHVITFTHWNTHRIGVFVMIQTLMRCSHTLTVILDQIVTKVLADSLLIWISLWLCRSLYFVFRSIKISFTRLDDSELCSSIPCVSQWCLTSCDISDLTNERRHLYFIQLEKISLSVLPFPQNRVFPFSSFTILKERKDQKKYTELKQEELIKLIKQLNTL